MVWWSWPIFNDVQKHCVSITMYIFYGSIGKKVIIIIIFSTRTWLMVLMSRSFLLKERCWRAVQIGSMNIIPGLPLARRPTLNFPSLYSISLMLSLNPREAKWIRLDFRFIMNVQLLFSVADTKYIHVFIYKFK